MKKKKRGRPRKKKGKITRRDFVRAGIVMSAYDEIRQSGEKHSVAIALTVEIVKQRYPKLRISETAVRRILAKWRPRAKQTILRFDHTSPTNEGLARIAKIRQCTAISQHPDAPVLPLESYMYPRKKVYKIRFAERPNYPRHNRKPSEDSPQ
jgi:hypothetical protein